MKTSVRPIVKVLISRLMEEARRQGNQPIPDDDLKNFCFSYNLSREELADAMYEISKDEFPIKDDWRKAPK